MAARTGMANLILRWRRLVADADLTIWTDDQAQQILDLHRVEIWQQPLTVQPLQIASGTVIYAAYAIPRGNLEEPASGTAAWRLYDAQGTAYGTALFVADYINGLITFSADQHGSARYIDARAYDLNGAAADAWRERAALQAGQYNFSTDGQSFSRAQFFEHCEKMAERYDFMSWPNTVTVVRSDFWY